MVTLLFISQTAFFWAVDNIKIGFLSQLKKNKNLGSGFNASRPLQCAKTLGISRLVLKMRLGTGQGAGAVVMERCCAASFHQNGLECTGQKESSHEQAEGSETSGAMLM